MPSNVRAMYSVYMTRMQGKGHPGQPSHFSKKKLPWVGFEPTTLYVLGERFANCANRADQLVASESGYTKQGN